MLRKQTLIRAVAAFCAVIALEACRVAEPGNEAAYANAAEPEAEPPAMPRPDPPFDRARLLAAVGQAASAVAAGAPNPRDQGKLEGRQFEIRLRFGCRGPVRDLKQTWLGWTRDRTSGSLRLRAAPTITAESEIASSLAGGPFEAVEGFWIPRPWLLQAVCPVAAAVKPALQASNGTDNPQAEVTEELTGTESRPNEGPNLAGHQRVGIVQVFTSADPRTGRRSERAFEAVKPIEDDQPLASQGFNLVLSGRLRAVPGQPVIQCIVRGPDQPPDCLATAKIDRVWIEHPDSGEVIAEWTVT